MTDRSCPAQELDTPARIDALAALGVSRLREGRPVEALEVLTRAADLYAVVVGTGEPGPAGAELRPALLNNLAIARAQCGDLPGAAAAARRSVDHARRRDGREAGGARRPLAAGLFTLAQALEYTDPTAAADAAREALEHWLELFGAPDPSGSGEATIAESVVVAARLAARLAAATGSPDGALDHLGAAAPAARRLTVLGTRGVEQAGGLLLDAAGLALRLDLVATGLEYATEAERVLAHGTSRSPNSSATRGPGSSTRPSRAPTSG